jgi:hypothetical protein
MILGLTSSGAVKIKTDGGLRAVECGCCGSIHPDACRDCPPFLWEFNFSVSGISLSGTIQEQFPAIVCPSENCNREEEFSAFSDIQPRTCGDGFVAYQPIHGGKYASVTLSRDIQNGCGWSLSLGLSGNFFEEGSVNFSESKFITSLDPRGSYVFQLFYQDRPPPAPPKDYNIFVSVT